MNNKHPEIKHIFFDLDHTLWDFDKNSELAFAQIFQTYAIKLNLQEFIDIYVPINHACWKLYEQNLMSAEELRLTRLEQTFDKLEYYMFKNELELIAKDYLEILPDFGHLFDDAIDVLKYLSKKYTLHIITNGFTEMQEKKMSNAKIKHFFKTVTDFELANAKKPDAKIFQHALDVAQAKKEESIMIGDSMHADVQGALDFGMKALFFNLNDKEKNHNYSQITDLKELKTMF